MFAPVDNYGSPSSKGRDEGFGKLGMGIVGFLAIRATSQRASRAHQHQLRYHLERVSISVSEKGVSRSLLLDSSFDLTWRRYGDLRSVVRADRTPTRSTLSSLSAVHITMRMSSGHEIGQLVNAPSSRS